MSAGTEALRRLGLSLAICDICGDNMTKPPHLSGPSVMWVKAKRHRFDKFYYVCSQRCRRRVKEGKVGGKHRS